MRLEMTSSKLATKRLKERYDIRSILSPNCNSVALKLLAGG